jgi:hypothetical protein
MSKERLLWAFDVAIKQEAVRLMRSRRGALWGDCARIGGVVSEILCVRRGVSDWGS